MAESTQLTLTQELTKMESQFAAALPPHIPVQKFVRVVMTAVNGNPDLQSADRRSLFESAMKCAADGLLPDGRDAAFVVFNTNAAGKGQPANWIKKVQYMPMVWGIAKKVRNSGELESMTAQVVYDVDTFIYQLGDDEKIVHTPHMGKDRGTPYAAYAIIKTKDGGVYREVMTEAEINKVREVSKAKDSGPWSGNFVTEMWRKTVLRRLMKRVPMSTDLQTVVERDDDLYDLNQARDVSAAPLKELPELRPQKITEVQAKKLYTLAQKQGIPDAELEKKIWLCNADWTSLRDITRDKYDEICAWATDWKLEPSTIEPSMADDDNFPEFEVPAK